MSAHENRLLAQMDAAAYADLLPHRKIIKLTSGEILAEALVEIDSVYFPHDAIISCVVALTGGGVIETAMIGRDGAFGATLSFDGKRIFNDAVVQVGGEEVAERHPGFRRQLLGYEQFHLVELQQTTACNAVHTVLARTCRWLCG